jgi:hypothetical protein
MSDTYSTTSEPAPGLTVNVAAPQPAQASVPAATESQVDAFLGAPAPASLQGGAPPETYQQDPKGGGFVSGAVKGASQQVLGALSLLPGIGDWFTRESYLGQRAYAPSRRGSESVGELVGTVAPWVLGGELLAGARGVSALSRLSPSLSRVLTGAERIAPAAGETGTAAGGIARLKPTVARGAAVGAVAGAAQEPAGDTGYLARIAPAAGGALGGAALTKLGLTGAQQKGVQGIVGSLAALMGYEAAGATGLGMTAFAMYALHRMGLGVRAADHLAPLIAAEARRAAGISGAGPVGAVIGQTINEVGKRT